MTLQRIPLSIGNAAHVASMANFMKLQNRSILVGYGTETGNSHDIAEQLGRMSQRLHFRVELCEMNQIQLSSLLKYSIVLFVISTTGLGELPKNSRAFWKRLLRKKLGLDSMDGVNYAILGLGDSSYQQFNWASLKLEKRLNQLGANSVMTRGECDIQHPDGIDQIYIPWTATFKQFLIDEFPLPPNRFPIPDTEPLPPQTPLIFTPQLSTPTDATPLSSVNVSASTINEPDIAAKFGMLTLKAPIVHACSNVSVDIPNKYPATLTCNTRITSKSHIQDVRILKFTISQPDSGSDVPEFMPGDTLNLYAKNFPIDVDNLIQWMNWQDMANNIIDWPALKSVSTDLIKSPTFTLRDLFLHSLDIFAVPSRVFFEKLSHFAIMPEQKERLLDFSKPEFTNEYYDYATRPRRSILEVLQEFDTVRIPAESVLDIFPIIRARQYSIANWPRRNPATGKTEVELVVALVKYRTILKRVRRGLVSRYLDMLPEGTEMFVTYTASSAKVSGETNAKRPLVCVATGTGVAPIRSLIQERRVHEDAGLATLYFGCRNQGNDFHFGTEWKEMEAAGTLTLRPAFSRDGGGKVYVQDLLRRDKEELAKWVDKDAIFFVCGGSRKMADAVKDTIKEAMVDFGGVEKDEVDVAFRKISWLEEIW